MGRAIAITVGEVIFSKKSELEKYVRALIAKYPVGFFLDEADQVFCLSLFRHHSEAAAKFGAGIQLIEVRLDIYGKKHFQIHRIDGTTDDISWPHCITNAKGDA